jgi:hypothetical protein
MYEPDKTKGRKLLASQRFEEDGDIGKEENMTKSHDVPSLANAQRKESWHGLTRKDSWGDCGVRMSFSHPTHTGTYKSLARRHFDPVRCGVK